MNKIIKRMWLVFAMFVITIALIFSLFRGLTPWISQYKSQLESELTQLVGDSVSIEKMETGWYWFEPVVKLNKVELRDGLKQDLKIKQLIVGINVWSSIRQWQLQPGILLADGLHLDLSEHNDHWQIRGLDRALNSQQSIAMDSLPGILRWILNQQRIDFKDTSMTIRLEGGTIIPLSLNRFSIENEQGNYKLQASAIMKQMVPTKLKMLASLNLNAKDIRRLNGQIYFDLKHILLSQWQPLFPKKYHHANSGTGRIQGWLDLKTGKISSFQGKVSLNNASLNLVNQQDHHFVQTFSSNFAWLPDRDGWWVNFSELKAKVDGESVNDQSLRFSYQNTNQQLAIMAPVLDLTVLRMIAKVMPKPLQPMLNNRLNGRFENVEVIFNQDQLEQFFAHFHIDQIFHQGLQTKISGLTGVVDANQQYGKIKLNSANVNIDIGQQMSLKDINLRTEAQWRHQGENWLIEILNSHLIHPHLKMTQQGKLTIKDDLNEINPDIDTDFILSSGKYWLDLMPGNLLPSKLSRWLKEDIGQITEVTGHMKLKGNLADFPYEKGKGTFAINTSFRDLSIAPVPGWQKARHLHGTLSVSGRELDAAVYQGHLGDVGVNRFRLNVTNLGLNKEVVKVHTQINGNSHAITDYLLATPLAQYLQNLKQVKVKGDIGVDVQVEVPLFEDGDPVYVVGQVVFNKNDILVEHDGIQFPLEKGRGYIHFNQNGITYGQLEGALWHQPMHIRLKSDRQSKVPNLKVMLEGLASTKEMAKVIPSPFWQFIEGKSMVKATLVMTDDDSDMDDFYIASDLKGISIRLPQPLSKPADLAVPTQTHIAFNPKLGFRKEVTMGDIVSANMWYSVKSNQVVLDKGEIRLGGSKATLPQNDGVQIVGSVSSLNLSEWKKALANFPRDAQSSEFAEKLKFVDIHIGNLNAYQQNFEQLICQISQPTKQQWHVKLKQTDLDVDLKYDAKQRLLTGDINQLSWHSKPGQSQVLPADITPDALPAVNLHINSLVWNTIPVGEVKIEGESQPGKWQLSLLSIKSPLYQIFTNGAWSLDNKINNTHLEGRAQVKNLGSILTQWHQNPVVSARWGQIDFQIDSKTNLFDINLANLKAKFSTLFRHGVVTQLSHETEEKIGLGKLLSILSLQTIPRRLQLDFSDLSSKGYSYDKFKGKFRLTRGNLSTQDSQMDGPVAFAAIKGSIDLLKQTYSVKLRIVPHITASLPVVATIAGGPIAGAVTWVVSKIITQEMQRVTGYSYQITGPWQHPEVHQLHIDKEKKINKKQANNKRSGRFV